MKIGIVGCAGRMGRILVREVLTTEGVTLTGALERDGSSHIGRDAGQLAGVEPCGVVVSDDPVALFARVDAVIDFTQPEATRAFARLAAQAKAVHVIGTTGLSADDDEALALAGRHTAIVRAANMSLGVNLLQGLTRRVAAALGDDFDIEIVEMHHRHKVDAPSGTALALGQAAADGRGVTLDERAVRARDGVTGERRRGDIGFATLRGGDVVGDHTIVFAGTGERIELTHKASSREVFGRGAVRAALWAHGQPPGVYSMHDVLGL